MAVRRIPRILTKEEADAILRQPNRRYPSGLRNRALLETLYRTGLRVSEACALQWANVKLDGKGPSYLEVRHGKRDGSRVVGVDRRLEPWLLRWRGFSRGLGSPWVFCQTNEGGSGRQGDPICSTYCRQMVHRYAQRAAIAGEPVTPHTFRHTFATELIEEGLGLHEVQALLGHANLSSTEKYLHTRPKPLLEKMNGRE